MHKIVAVIPARGGSKGVVNKNIRDLCGQPLIAYSILDGIRCKSIEETYVTTDCPDIAQISMKYGAEVPFLRPKKYAQDTSPDIEWAQHFLSWYKERYSTYPEYIVHLRATTPFKKLEVIEAAIQKIKSEPEATSLVSVEEFGEVYKSFTIPKNSQYLSPIFDIRYHLMPRQSLEPTYLPNGYVDILKTETLLKGSFHGDKILAHVVPKVCEIDTEADLEYAEFKGNQFL